MRALRYAAAGLLAAGLTLGTAALSRVPWAPDAGQGAVLRLSWRVRGERVERCRQLSAQEQAKQPAHMRRTEICEGGVLPYVLTVDVDGRTVVHDTVQASGARADRPLYVFREIPVRPGPRRLSVRFVRQGGEAREDEEEDEEEEDEERRTAAPPVLELAGTPRIGPREVFLVTYDEDGRALVARRPAPRR